MQYCLKNQSSCKSQALLFYIFLADDTAVLMIDLHKTTVMKKQNLFRNIVLFIEMDLPPNAHCIRADNG